MMYLVKSAISSTINVDLFQKAISKMSHSVPLQGLFECMYTPIWNVLWKFKQKYSLAQGSRVCSHCCYGWKLWEKTWGNTIFTLKQRISFSFYPKLGLQMADPVTIGYRLFKYFGHFCAFWLQLNKPKCQVMGFSDQSCWKTKTKLFSHKIDSQPLEFSLAKVANMAGKIPSPDHNFQSLKTSTFHPITFVQSYLLWLKETW